MARAGHTGRARQAPDADAVFRRAVDDAKGRYNLSDIVARNRKVTRAGPHEKRALCAFHSERTPSMHLNDAKGTFHCFGCSASGDILTYVMDTEHLDFMGAMRWLGAADLPAVDPAERAKAAEEDAADRALAIAEARRIWNAAVPTAGTPAEVYARSRGVTMTLPPSIRFGHVYAWRDADTGEVGPDLPAVIAAVVDGAGEITGLQRIFLARGGQEKARMQKPKRSLGRIRGGSLRLGPPATEIVVCEGPEDGWTLAQELSGRSVWVVLGTAMMPEVQYPPKVRSIVIAGQNDAPGRAAVAKAEAGLHERGYAVRTMWPAEGFKDWNDQLRGIRS